MARDLKFSDPQYPKQWHLKNQRYIGNDCNVTSVWEYNITGKGVVVAVVDDGNVFVNPLRPKYHQKYLSILSFLGSKRSYNLEGLKYSIMNIGIKFVSR